MYHQRRLRDADLFVAGELTVQALCGVASGVYGFIECGEVAEVMALAQERDTRREPAFHSGNPLGSCGAVVAYAGIHPIFSISNRPEISNPVVQAVSIDVVEHIWDWLAVDEQPCDAVCSVGAIAKCEAPIRRSAASIVAGDRPSELAIPPLSASGITEMRKWARAPCEDAGSRVILHAFANVSDIRQTESSHSDPPRKGRLVRGDDGANDTASPRF